MRADRRVRVAPCAQSIGILLSRTSSLKSRWSQASWTPVAPAERKPATGLGPGSRRTVWDWPCTCHTPAGVEIVSPREGKGDDLRPPGRIRLSSFTEQFYPSSFTQRRDSASFQRIQLGLKARRGIQDAVDESGAIIQQDADEGTPDLG